MLWQNKAKQHSQLRTAFVPIIRNNEGIMWEGETTERNCAKKR